MCFSPEEINFRQREKTERREKEREREKERRGWIINFLSVPSRFCQERLRVSRLSPSLRNRIKVKSNTASALEETRKGGREGGG